MLDELLVKINYYANKEKTEGLTPEELTERDALRKQYLFEFRKNLRGMMENAYIKNEDGTLEKLKRKSEK